MAIFVYNSPAILDAGNFEQIILQPKCEATVPQPTLTKEQTDLRWRLGKCNPSGRTHDVPH